MTTQDELIKAALSALGIERFVLAIHDVSFPSMPDEDIGRGSPHTRGGHDFLAFVRELGFDGLQLGPQGQTSRDNPSPYDGSVFSKNVLSIALAELTTPPFANLVDAKVFEEAVRETPAGASRAHYTHAFDAQRRILAGAAASLRERCAAGDASAIDLAGRVASFASRAEWLAHDARFEAFTAAAGTDDWTRWPLADHAPSPTRIEEVERQQRAVLEAYALGQYVLDVQHHALRQHLRSLGMRAYGDLQVGLSLRDRWARGHLFLDGYRMGAPPSRTNPDGQPWGYPVLDPRQYLRRFVGEDRDAAPLAFVRARATKLFAELDGLRINHPHGLVCPWVYDGRAPDPSYAVAHGARLFETPRSDLHPSLAPFALVRPDQIVQTVPAYDDHHVRELSAAQASEYGQLFDVVMESARRAGRSKRDVLCEVLSTCPAPLACVMERHGLGRFRVTQKASLVDVEDGYRGENARPPDWTMIGNHDTEPLLAVVDRWRQDRTMGTRADYLATRLEPDARRRAAFARTLAADPRRLSAAMFAELFAGPASNVLVFFADLFGERSVYNTPGLVSDRNWSMRVPRNFRVVYTERRARGDALDVPGALAMAMRARGDAFVAAHADVIEALASRSVLTSRAALT